MRHLILVLFLLPLNSYAERLLCMPGDELYAVSRRPQSNSVEQSLRPLCRHKRHLLTAARSRRVSAIAMTSCLLAEHHLLVGLDDTLVDIAASVGIGNNPSLGVTQVKLYVGMELARRIYGREISKSRVRGELLNPETAFLYMAELLKSIQRNYRINGFDVSRRIDLLCSSYQVGNSEIRARAHRLDKTQPQSNRYGRLANVNKDLARDFLYGDFCPTPIQPKPVLRNDSYGIR